MLNTWQRADPSANDTWCGNFEAALASVKARALLMPCDRDLYFTLEDNAAEAAMVPGARLRPFHSVYGHCAGAPGRFAAEAAFLDAALRELLAQ